jgi:hypothetical protein
MTPGADAARAEILSKTAGWNYDCHHPGIIYCGGCSVKIDGEAMLEDLREAGWDLVPAVREAA